MPPDSPLSLLIEKKISGQKKNCLSFKIILSTYAQSRDDAGLYFLWQSLIKINKHNPRNQSQTPELISNYYI